jgi:hypothetical protein
MIAAPADSQRAHERCFVGGDMPGLAQVGQQSIGVFDVQIVREMVHSNAIR